MSDEAQTTTPPELPEGLFPEGYDGLDVAQVVDVLKTATPEDVAAVIAYEEAQKRPRKGIIEFTPSAEGDDGDTDDSGDAGDAPAELTAEEQAAADQSGRREHRYTPEDLMRDSEILGGEKPEVVQAALAAAAANAEGGQVYTREQARDLVENFLQRPVETDPAFKEED